MHDFPEDTRSQPCDCARGELSHPWHQALWGCPLLLQAGLGTGKVSWFGSDKDPTAQGAAARRWNTQDGWVGVGAGFTESQDKLFSPSPFGPSLWFSLSSRPSGCILNHPSQHIPTPAPPSQPWAVSVLFLQVLYRHEMQPQRKEPGRNKPSSQNSNYPQGFWWSLHAETQPAVQAVSRVWGSWCLFSIATVFEQWQVERFVLTYRNRGNRFFLIFILIF